MTSVSSNNQASENVAWFERNRRKLTILAEKLRLHHNEKQAPLLLELIGLKESELHLPRNFNKLQKLREDIEKHLQKVKKQKNIINQVSNGDVKTNQEDIVTSEKKITDKMLDPIRLFHEDILNCLSFLNLFLNEKSLLNEDSLIKLKGKKAIDIFILYNIVPRYYEESFEGY